MTTPVHTVGAEVLAQEASIAMMTAGVNHMPVLDADGTVVGILSASSLMTLDTRSPFALRRSLQQARNEDELVQPPTTSPSSSSTARRQSQCRGASHESSRCCPTR